MVITLYPLLLGSELLRALQSNSGLPKVGVCHTFLYLFLVKNAEASSTDIWTSPRFKLCSNHFKPLALLDFFLNECHC